MSASRRRAFDRLRLEALEDRTLPSVVAGISGSTLQVSLSANDTSAHSLTLRQDFGQLGSATAVLDSSQLVGTFNNSFFSRITVALGPGDDAIDVSNVQVP